MWRRLSFARGMASYDQLPDQQRAVVDLVVKRGRSYDQLADTLGMPVERVRTLAHQTLADLAPVSAAAVDEGWRAEIADYLLGQQEPPAAAATRGHLRRSEAARAWSRSVLDSLEHLYANGDMPTIPSGESGSEPAPPPAGAPARELSPQEAAAAVRRRRIAGGALAALAVLIAVLVWPIGVLTGGGDGEPDAGGQAGGQAGAASADVIGQAVLRPVGDANRERHAGIAVITGDGEREELNIQAQLRPTGRNRAYEVWLYDSERDAVSLGAQVTDEQGNFAGRQELPDDWRDYRAIDVSREPIDDDESHSGNSVLRTGIDRITAP